MQLITNPDEFFGELKKKDVRIRKPLVIVLVLAIILSLYQYLLMSKLSQAFPAEIARFFAIGAYIGIAGSFIGMFAIWLILAAIMHILSALFGGNGSFRRTFKFTGYGFLPSLISSLVTVPLSAYYVLQAKIPQVDVSQLQNPEIMKSLMLSVIPQDMIYSNLIINLAITLWGLILVDFCNKACS